MDHKIENLTKEKAAYIGKKINEIVPHEVDADEEEFVLKVENENGEIIGGCVAEAYEEKCERDDFCRKLVNKDGKFAAGVIANVNKGQEGFVTALFVEEPLRHQGLGTCLLREVEKLVKENNTSVVLTSAGDWSVGFFKKNGYLIRGELKDVPKGHNCYELYKGIEGIDCEVVPIVNKGAACGLINIQILTKKDGGQELRLTYNDEKYKKDTAEKVLALYCEMIGKIMADMTRL